MSLLYSLIMLNNQHNFRNQIIIFYFSLTFFLINYFKFIILVLSFNELNIINMKDNENDIY